MSVAYECVSGVLSALARKGVGALSRRRRPPMGAARALACECQGALQSDGVFFGKLNLERHWSLIGMRAIWLMISVRTKPIGVAWAFQAMFVRCE